MKQDEYVDICGVDKGDIPERVIYRNDGTMAKSGWRRTLKILIDKHFVDRRKAEKVFGYCYESRKSGRPRQKTAEQTLFDIQKRHL